ncbi:hypothetical protein CEXT_459351 [Caerostris extrusa]|uniref:Uncharacterized protein n=1 Tax=Caerostris extrusa TaxID=172846 RepID=A0AAV4MDP3_CAEEX|nr:hypothetical protein CEXT_459351 [Caerostris extrusa]
MSVPSKAYARCPPFWDLHESLKKTQRKEIKTIKLGEIVSAKQLEGALPTYALICFDDDDAIVWFCRFTFDCFSSAIAALEFQIEDNNFPSGITELKVKYGLPVTTFLSVLPVCRLFSSWYRNIAKEFRKHLKYLKTKIPHQDLLGKLFFRRGCQELRLREVGAGGLFYGRSRNGSGRETAGAFHWNALVL